MSIWAVVILASTVGMLLSMGAGYLLGKSSEKARRLKEVEEYELKLYEFHVSQIRLEREATKQIHAAKEKLEESIRHRSNSPLNAEEARQMLERAEAAFREESPWIR